MDDLTIQPDDARGQEPPRRLHAQSLASRRFGAEGGTASPSRVGTYARASPAREAWEGHASRVLDRARAAEGPTCTSYINDGDVGKPVGLGYRTCRCTR